MQHDLITMFCCTNLSGQVRGKGFPTRQIEKRLKGGIGWTPNYLMFTALGTIAPGVWGAHGDVMLMPDPKTGVEVDFGDGTAAERFYRCDVQNTDGTPWDCCLRTLPRDAAAEFLAETGLVLKATFEHEFIYSGANSRTGDNYALDAVRRHGMFGETYLGALRAARVEVDSYLAEFGPGQFEVTVPLQEVVHACDTAVIVKEMAHATAHRLGHGVTFSPRVDSEGLGSGMHIHFNQWDQSGHPVSHDPARPHGLGVAAGQFLSGVVRHMPDLCAFNAPSLVSYLRLVSHFWTGVWSNVGPCDREAGLRIYPTFGTSPEAVARQFNFEHRAADATANPCLQLAVILRASLAGIDDALPPPEYLAARNIVRLPTSANAALVALVSDIVVQGFLPQRMYQACPANKRAEIELSRDWTPAEICKRYA